MKKKNVMFCVLLVGLLLSVFLLVGCGANNSGGDTGANDTTTESGGDNADDDSDNDTENAPTICTHVFGDWQTETPATCTTNGERKRTCVKCGQAETETIAAGHRYAEEYSFDKDFHWFAAVCGCADAPIQKTHHDFTEDTCSVCHREYAYTKGLQYTLRADGQSYAVKQGGSMTDSVLRIPKFHNGLPVTEIETRGFRACHTIVHAELPDSITMINSAAFRGCYNMQSIELPNSLLQIGDEVFSCCAKLESICVPKSVVSIGDRVFEFCDVLQHLSVQNGNGKYHSKSDCIIETAAKKLIAGGKNSIIPTDGSVTSIADSAFCGRKGLTSIILPNAVQIIEDSAFNNCRDLTSIKFSDLTKKIGSAAFLQCVSLESITIPSAVQEIGDIAFMECVGITSLTVKNGNRRYHSAGNCIIDTAQKILAVGCNVSVIPANTSVTSIGKSAFQGMTMESIVIPENIKSIGSFAFCSCKNLTSISLPNDVTSIGECAFRSCDALASVSMGNRVANFGEYAFAYCKALTGIKLPSSLVSIGQAAFLGCDNLASIVIPSGVTTMGRHVFYDCVALENIWCEATRKPMEWASDSGSSWKGNCSAAVYWKNDWEYNENGMPVPKAT